MICTVDGRECSVTDWKLRVAPTEEWRANIAIEADSTITDGASVRLADDIGNAWVGTARAVTTLGANTWLDVVAGAASLDKPTKERFYAGRLDAVGVLGDLCSDAGEVASAEPIAQIAQWRTRGHIARREIQLLALWTSGRWRVLPSGEVSLAVPASPVEAINGELVDSANAWREYSTDEIPDLLGATIDGWKVGTFVYERWPKQHVTVYPETFRMPETRAAIVGATVQFYDSGRVDCVTDTGTLLGGVPIWAMAGYKPKLRPGARVFIADLGDDPRATVAFCAPNEAGVDLVEVAQGESELIPAFMATGRVIRYGDMLVFPSGAAATPTAMVCTPATVPALPVPVSRLKG